MGGGGFVETCCNNAFLSTSVALETKTHDFRIVLRLYTTNEVQKPKYLNEAPSELTLASCCEKETGCNATHAPDSCLPFSSRKAALASYA